MIAASQNVSDNLMEVCGFLSMEMEIHDQNLFK